MIPYSDIKKIEFDESKIINYGHHRERMIRKANLFNCLNSHVLHIKQSKISIVTSSSGNHKNIKSK